MQQELCPTTHIDINKNPCSTRKNKKAVPGLLASLSTKEMQSKLQLTIKKKPKPQPKRAELCGMYVDRFGPLPPSLCISLGFPRNDGRNSCYIDALLMAFFHRPNAWLQRILLQEPYAKNVQEHAPRLLHHADNIRQQLRIIAHGIQNPKKKLAVCSPLRSALSAFDKAYDKVFSGREPVEWTHTQQEPQDLLSAFQRFANFPPNLKLLHQSDKRSSSSSPPRTSRATFNSPYIYASDLVGKRYVKLSNFIPKHREHKHLTTTITNVPPTLFFNVMRNYLDEEKVLTPVIPLEFAMDNALECISILLHHGSRPSSGHYTTLIKYKKNGLWYHYDDLDRQFHYVGTWKDVLAWNNRFALKNSVGYVYKRIKKDA